MMDEAIYIAIANEPVSYTRTKYVDIRYYYEAVQDSMINLTYTVLSNKENDC